jgi:hypothetical protein
LKAASRPVLILGEKKQHIKEIRDMKNQPCLIWFNFYPSDFDMNRVFIEEYLIHSFFL